MSSNLQPTRLTMSAASTSTRPLPSTGERIFSGCAHGGTRAHLGPSRGPSRPSHALLSTHTHPLRPCRAPEACHAAHDGTAQCREVGQARRVAAHAMQAASGECMDSTRGGHDVRAPFGPASGCLRPQTHEHRACGATYSCARMAKADRQAVSSEGAHPVAHCCCCCCCCAAAPQPLWCCGTASTAHASASKARRAAARGLRFLLREGASHALIAAPSLCAFRWPVSGASERFRTSGREQRRGALSGAWKVCAAACIDPAASTALASSRRAVMTMASGRPRAAREAAWQLLARLLGNSFQRHRIAYQAQTSGQQRWSAPRCPPQPPSTGRHDPSCAHSIDPKEGAQPLKHE